MNRSLSLKKWAEGSLLLFLILSSYFSPASVFAMDPILKFRGNFCKKILDFWSQASIWNHVGPLEQYCWSYFVFSSDILLLLRLTDHPKHENAS